MKYIKTFENEVKISDVIKYKYVIYNVDDETGLYEIIDKKYSQEHFYGKIIFYFYDSGSKILKFDEDNNRPDYLLHFGCDILYKTNSLDDAKNFFESLFNANKYNL